MILSPFGVGNTTMVKSTSQASQQGLFVPYGSNGGVKSVHIALAEILQEIILVLGLSFAADSSQDANKIVTVLMIGIIVAWGLKYFTNINT